MRNPLLKRQPKRLKGGTISFQWTFSGSPPSFPGRPSSSKNMTHSTPEAETGSLDLRKERRITLAVLALCALITLTQGIETRPETDPLATSLAIALGLATIFLRRLALARNTTRDTAERLGSACLAASAGLGILGVWTAISHEAGQTGLLFVLAGVLFSIRPLQPMAPPEE